jgi:hypothetical protein
MRIKKAKRGVSKSRVFVCPAGLLSDVDTKVVARVREMSGYKANRSRLIQALFELALDSVGRLNAEEVIDVASLAREFGK